MSKVIFILSTVTALALSLSGELVAQDSDHQAHHTGDQNVEMQHAEDSAMSHEHSAADMTDDSQHSAMTHDAMNHEEMGLSDMTESEVVSLRDPHAYSGGYERASGPYSLPSQPQVVLADEEIFAGIWMDRFELVDHENGEGAELEGFAWLGNSYRQILLQAQIETVEGEVEAGEVDLLYSRAVSPFWNIRAGLHRSFGESADRDWAAIGIKGLAPYWFEVDAALHLGDNGHAAFDLEVEYELLLTQRLVLQPRIDIAAFSKADVELGRGSGLSTIKAGARLRYELDRQFAPYLGVERVRRFGETVDLLPMGSHRAETHWVLGLLFWF